MTVPRACICNYLTTTDDFDTPIAKVFATARTQVAEDADPWANLGVGTRPNASAYVPDLGRRDGTGCRPGEYSPAPK